MPNLLAAAVGYGGYISLVKFVILVVLYFAWMPLVKWVNTDAIAIRTKARFWTRVVAGAGAFGIIIWLLAPVYLIGLLVYLIAVGASAVAYVVHRNSMVSEFQKVLTREHIKSLFVNEEKKIAAASKGYTFITANGNEAPFPAPKTPDSFGFKTACEVLDDALWRRAGDIVFQPTAEDYSVTYFVDGLGTPQEPRPREEMEYFIRYLKQLGDMDLEEKRKPQKGTFKVMKDHEKVAWDIVTAGSTAGEQLKISKAGEYNLLKIDEIGLTPKQVEEIGPFRELDKGLIIISGPKKSGVTLSLYAALKNHDPFMNSINILEKKPTAELQNITQHTFSLSDTGTTTYANKLQTILRMGPDIIGIADCEDSEMAGLACMAAKDGMTVYVTMEATSAMQALGKWIKLVSNKKLIGQTLVGIMNQRLARVLCDECKQAYQPNQELFKKFNIPADKTKVLYRPGEIEYDKHGKPIMCQKCQGTGFVGRTGIFETMVLDDNLRDVVNQSKSLQEIASHFRRGGMLYMQEQAINKVVAGITSINEVIRLFSSKEKPQKKTK